MPHSADSRWSEWHTAHSALAGEAVLRHPQTAHRRAIRQAAALRPERRR